MKISFKLTTLFVIISMLIIVTSSSLFYIYGSRPAELRTGEQLLNGIILLSTALVLFTAAIGLMLARSFTKPIFRLRNAAQRMSRGHLDTEVNISGGDELTDLAKAFNEMQVRVRDAKAGLESEVHKRTVELHETIDRLRKSEAEAVKMSAELKLAMEKQKKMEKAKIEFLTITSHELRTPITPMKAQLQMLSCEYLGKLTEEQKKSMDLILKNITTLDHLIADILDISKLDSGVMKFDIEKSDLNNVVESAVRLMRLKAKEKDIQISLRMEHLSSFEFDSERVKQVILNLLSNSTKFTNPKGNILVEVLDNTSGAAVKVRDSGIGIDIKDRRRIFEPFEQVESGLTRSYEGTGLGLAVCKGIIEKHGGEITVDSEVGKGSTFTFTLPYRPHKRPDEIHVSLFSI